VIIVADTIAPGNLRLPRGMRNDDYVGIAQYVIEQIGQSRNRDAHVVAFLNVVPGYIKPGDYIRAGADTFDSMNSPSRFTNLIKSYLTS
jgi:hypothetical protein